MSKEVKKDEKNIYPDQLNITIRTSVPGYQKIEYKPSMTIKDSDEKSVNFTPLIKLNQSTIDKIPKEYKIKQFFNKGLFQSLLNYNGGTAAKNLTQATRSGYVDNNIKITLNTIFPVGSVIYIGNKPYAIKDTLWTTGDWKIEIKQKKEEIDIDKITNPLLYSQFVKDEIISGEEYLAQIPQSILVGNNYTGPDVIVPGLKDVPGKTTPSTQPTDDETKQIVLSSTTLTHPPPKSQPRPPPVVKQQIAAPSSTQPTTSQQLPPPLKNVPLLPPFPQVDIEELLPEEERLFETFKQDLKISLSSSHFFRSYFQQQNYFNLVRNVFNRFPAHLKTEIRKFYFITTNYQPKTNSTTMENLSPTSYNKLCNQVTILTSPSDGDCFFKAVADGLNIYNYENQSLKITYANYGKTELFTINVLREIVLRYIQGLDPKIIEEMQNLSEIEVEPLNKSFEESIEKLKSELNVPQLTQDQYKAELKNIYNSNPNFLIYKPTLVPIDVDEYKKPFRVLEYSEISKYIKSKDYWANDIAIQAICSILNICIIPIEKYSYTKIIKNRPKNIDKLRALLSDKDFVNDICSKKTMFLFYNNNHYELIRFIYLTREEIKIVGEGLRKNIEYKSKWYTIFKASDLSPPIHILLLIYGTIYSQLDDNSNADFNLFPYIMQKINSSVIKNITITNTFTKLFDDVFPNKKSIEKILNLKELPSPQSSIEFNPSTEESDKLEIIGGQYGRPPPYYGYPPIQKIAYAITIDIQLHPGTSLTPQQISESKCNSRYNAIRKAFSEFTGKPYVIPPVYREKEKSNNTKKNITQTSLGGKTRKKKY
jgi:hypothetical protein